MRSSFLARHKVGIASAVVVALTASAVVAYALSAEGFTTHHADLNDGGVWTVNSAEALLGRVNKPIEQLDAYLLGGDPDSKLDVVQDGAAVALRNGAAGTLTPIDVTAAKAVSTAKLAVPIADVVAMNGGTLAILDPASGKVWATTYDPDAGITDLSAADPNGKPLTTVGAHAALAVADDGAITLASAAKGITTMVRAGTGFDHPISRPLPASASGTHYSVTTVGTDAVVLVGSDGSTESTLVLPDGTTKSLKDASTAALQRPGPASDDVLVASRTTLSGYPLSGGEPHTLFDKGGDGAPAAPVVVGGCTFAAWSTEVSPFVKLCADAASVSYRLQLGTPTSSLVFRVNRGQVLLNESGSGQTWDIRDGKPQDVANWDEVRPKKIYDSDKNDNHDNQTQQHQVKPPTTEDHPLGARVGQVTSLYVLDGANDPTGGVLTVDSVKANDPPDAELLSISPDAQTVQIDMPATRKTPVQFAYTISSNSGKTATGHGVVTPVDLEENRDPEHRLRWTPRTWSVAPNGTISVPVLADWRDYRDGDEVELTNAQSAKGTAVVTTDGVVLYQAPTESGPQNVDYTISDGHGGSVRGAFTVNVLTDSANAVAPVAQPDAARGIVGSPIVIHPLANDEPGADPAHPSSSLQLAATLAQPDGFKVTTDLSAGTVTVTADQTGTKLLSYQVIYGDAPLGRNVIRVTVEPKSASTRPVAAPDVITVHGKQPAIVDVLANDFDPRGYVLAVQHAQAADPAAPISVGIIDGHWLRVQAAGELAPTTQLISYTIADGTSDPATGQLSVTQLPDVTDDTPVALADYAVVRAGDATVIPVLDNDVSRSGAPLALDKSGTGSASGSLTVSDGPGRAYVSGRVVRYVAPATVPNQTPATIDYTAETPDGSQQSLGQVHITVTPPRSQKNPDQAPAPPTVEARVVAGDKITIKLPSTGIDPDGDSVVCTGIETTPVRGRVLAIGPNSITYEAYPFQGNGGTDTFDYVVTDTQGTAATGTVRIAVLEPGDRQNPVAVDDFAVAAPGSTLKVDALANDLVSSRTNVRIADLADSNSDLGSNVRLKDGLVSVVVPDGATRPIVFQYRVDDDGILSSAAQVTITVRPKTNVPPVAFDQFASADAKATSVSLDPLTGDRPAYDPDSDGPLALTTAYPGVTTANGTMTIPLTDSPQAVPYVVTDSEKGAATAMIYVPATLAGLPRLKVDANIRTAPGASQPIDITKYVLDPSRKRFELTSAAQIGASPARGLSVDLSKVDPTHLTLRASSDYEGPGEVHFEVREGSELNTTRRAVLSIPVQVGQPTPVLRCPTDYVTTVDEGGADVPLGIGSLCHVWVPSTLTDALRYTVSWKKAPGGVDLIGSGSAEPALRPTGAASPDTTGTFDIGIVGFPKVTAVLSMRVVRAAPLTIRTIPVTGLKADESTTIHLADYAQSPLRDPQYELVGTPQRRSGSPQTSISVMGSAVKITVGHTSRGRVVFAFNLTDSPRVHATERQATGQIVLTILGVPDPPRNLRALSARNQNVKLSWESPAYGSPDRYTVYWRGSDGAGSGHRDCATGCVVPGLINGRTYEFWATATNAAGTSRKSGSVAAKPDHVPDAVQHLRPSNPQDRQVTLTWDPVNYVGDDKVQYYLVSGPVGVPAKVAAPGTTTELSTPDNKIDYSFTVVAHNRAGDSVPATIKARSAGKPTQPVNLGVQYGTEVGQPSARQLLISWDVGDLEGEGPARYSVTRDGATVADCVKIAATTCEDVPPTGSSYSYAVTEQNAAATDAPLNHVSDAAETTFFSAGQPAQVTGVSLGPVEADDLDGTVTVSYVTAPSHGTSLTMHCEYSAGSSWEGCAESTWVRNSGGSPFAPGGNESDDHQVSGLPDGQTVAIRLWESNHDDTSTGGSQQSRQGPKSDSASSPGPTNGPPTAPQDLSSGACGRAARDVTFHWGAANGTGSRTIDHYQVTEVNGAFSDRADGTEHTVNRPADGGITTVDVVAYDNKGEPGNALRTSCDDAGTSVVTVSKGALTTGNDWDGPQGYCTKSACAYIHVSVTNLNANSRFQISFSTNCATTTIASIKSCNGNDDPNPETQDPYKSETSPITTDANGNWSGDTRIYGYPNAAVWVHVEGIRSSNNVDHW